MIVYKLTEKKIKKNHEHCEVKSPQVFPPLIICSPHQIEERYFFNIVIINDKLATK